MINRYKILFSKVELSETVQILLKDHPLEILICAVITQNKSIGIFFVHIYGSKNPLLLTGG